MLRRLFIAIALIGFIAGCNGGSGNVPPFTPGTAITPTPTPTPTPPPTSASGTFTTSTTLSSSGTFGPIGPGDTGSTSCAPASAVATFAVVFSLTQPAGTPTVAAMRRRPRNIGGASIAPFGYFTLTPNVTVTCPNTPTFAITFPSASAIPAAASNAYVAIYDPGNPGAGWNTVEGTATITGNTLSWTSSGVPVSLVGGRTYSFVLFTTSSTLAVPTPTPTPTPSPTPSPTPTPLHLYVANDNTPGGIQQFTLPLSSSSTPNFTIAGNDLVAVAVDTNGNLCAGDFHHKIFCFTAPLSGFSTPNATFNNGTAGNVGQLMFPTSGPQQNQLWSASVGTEIDRFVPPFTNATTAAQQTFPTGASQIVGLVFDSSQNMYLSNVNNLYVYAPPYSNPPAVVTPALSDTSYRKEAVIGNQLFVAMPISTPQPLGRVDVYNLPLTNASVPAFTMIGTACPCPPGNGINIPEALAADPAGNLYVGNLGNRSITVYAPPFSAASTPTTTLTLPSPFAIFGIAVGK